MDSIEIRVGTKGDIRMLKDRQQLEDNLKITVKNYKHDRNIVAAVKEQLKENGILPGATQELFTKTNFDEQDLGLLCLFTMALFNQTKENLIRPIDYFTNKEMQKAKQRKYTMESNDIAFPIKIEEVTKLDDENYITVMMISEIEKLYNSNLLEYNFETQRTPKYKRSKDAIIEVPDINRKSVQEIKQNTLNKTYLPDTITLNVLAGSSEDGDELDYDPNTRQLNINESEIDVLDGFHRISAFVLAREENDEVDIPMQVAIKNYDVETARKYFGQINTINKVDTTRIKSLKAERYSDYVVKQLMRNSDLKGKVSETSHPSKLKGHLVSYGLLSDEIDKQFKMDSKKDAMDVSGYLTEFFDYLLGSFEDEFLNNPEETKSRSLINNNNTFIGYIVLAKRFREDNIGVSKIIDVVNSIDFSRDNKMWEEIGVVENGKIARKTSKARNAIRKYFEELSLN